MRRPLFMVSLCLVVVVAMFHWMRPTPETADPPDGSHIVIIGKVFQKEENSFAIRLQTENTFQNDATVLWQSNPMNKTFHHSRFQCEYENAPQLILGSTVILEGDFASYTQAANPGEFDYALYYHSLGYTGRMKNVQLLAWDGKKPGLRDWLYDLRCFWENRLYEIFPEKEASIMAAILLGDKSNLDSDIKELYQRNGIIHILSISGLHITLLGLGLYQRLRRLGLPVWASALSGSILLLLYGMLTGFGVSSCRAIGMYLLRMLAQVLGRTYDMLTALGVMAAGMVCTHPAWLDHMGFLLSFSSILGVGALLPALTKQTGEHPRQKLRRYLEGKWRKKLSAMAQKWMTALRQGLLAGFSITVTTLPVQLWFSYEIPVYSIFLNVLILPFMGIVMAAGLLAMLIPGMGLIGTIDVLILTGYEALCRFFEKLPHSVWNPGRPEIWKIVLYYLIWIFVVCEIFRPRKCFNRCPSFFWQIIRGHRLQFVLLFMAVTLTGLPHFHGNQVTFLDVGQGDGMCIQLASGEVYLFDCGSSSRKKIGERVLIPFLKYHGIHRVDGVFISHGDADHMNGLLELFALSEQEHLTISQVILPDIARDLWQEQFGQILQTIGEMKTPPVVTTIHAGMTWQSGENSVSFLCLHPSADGANEGGNAGSECFYITFSAGKETTTLLLTGDVEGSGERELLMELKRYGITDIDILKCPHHGSRGTTSQELLAQITPADTVISCGRGNRYGHPHAELLKRLKGVGSRIYQTPQTGAVTMRLKRTGYELVPYK